MIHLAAKSKKKKQEQVEFIKYTCTKCGVEKKETEYYKSDSPLYEYNKKCGVCKSCVGDIFMYLIDKFEYPKVAVFYLCMMLDYPFFQSIFETADAQSAFKGTDVYKTYFQKLNSAIGGNVNSWGATSFFEGEEIDKKELGGKLVNTAKLRKDLIKKVTKAKKEEEKEMQSMQVNREMIARWGTNLTDINDYIFLENQYQDLIKCYASDTYIQKMLYEEIARIRLELNNVRGKGKPGEYEKLLSSLSKLTSDANLLPKQATAASDTSLSTWGEWIRKIEEEEPIPEPSEEFKDVDGIMTYIQKWFVGHFEKMLGLANINEIDENELLIEVNEQSAEDGEQ